MAASQSGVFSLQEFSDIGAPLVGGRLYTYVYGTTTHKTAYTDKAGTIPHTYTSDGIGGQYIALNARGELPAPLYLAAGSYDIALKDASGATIWTRRADPVDDTAAALDSAIRSDLASTSDATKGAGMVGLGFAELNAVATTSLAKQRETKSLFNWLTDAQKTLVSARGPYGTSDRSAILTALENAWTDALAGDLDLYAPPGLYEIGEANFPWRNTVNTSLLDAKDITLWCSGPNTEFKTVSVNGGDVFQINALKNFHVRGFPKLTSTISGTTAGSNGVSITNGGDNLDFDIYCENLASLDKTIYVDGGKAFTIQPGTGANELGRISARVIAKGCAEGFGYEPDLVTSMTKRTAIHVDVMAEDCFYAVKFSAAGATSALTTAMTSGLCVKAHAINCQKDVGIGRMHGGDIDVHVVTTKTAAARRLNPSGVTWFAADTLVEALVCSYAHNARISVRGNKGACDYKARIGGTTAGSSGLIGATDDSEITLDIGGTAATADIAAIDSGGNTLRNSKLACSVRTCSTLPDDFYAAELRNDLQIGTVNVGSFTGTLTGCTTAPIGLVEWSLNDDIVTLEIPTISGTSNTTVATITGMPVNIRPSTAQSCMGVTVDNGTAVVGRIVVETNGTITLYNGVSSAFTASSTKGVQFSTIHYRRS